MDFALEIGRLSVQLFFLRSRCSSDVLAVRNRMQLTVNGNCLQCFLWHYKFRFTVDPRTAVLNAAEKSPCLN
jgi:hypothetical protein